MLSISSEPAVTATESYYGLLSPPFSLTPDPRFVYHSRSHLRALEQVNQALRRREGFIVVTGEIGVGKTMLCRTLLEHFEARTFLSVVMDPQLGVEDLLRQVLRDFGQIAAPQLGSAPREGIGDRHQLVSALQGFLASLVSLDAHAVILIDEAQHVAPAVLEQLRLLSNFETDRSKLLQVVLVGQPDLDDLLARDDLRQLNQRIARRYQLHALSRREVEDYIARRLTVAAAGPGKRPPRPETLEESEASEEGGVRFTASGVRTVAAISQGTPRVVNVLCDRALDVGREREQRLIDRRIVLAAARQMKMRVPAALRVPTVRVGSVAALLAVVAAGVLGLWWSWQDREAPPARPAVIVLQPAPAPVAVAVADPSLAPALEPATPAPEIASDLAPLAVEPDAPPDPGATPVAAGAQGFQVAVASFRTETRARQVTADITALGLPVAARFDAGSQWYLIVVGPYDSAEEARAAQSRLSENGFADTRVSGTAP